MLIGPRAASIPIQIVALLLGIVEGWLLYHAVRRRARRSCSRDVLSPPILFLCIAFCAYFLAAPTTWRGLARRGSPDPRRQPPGLRRPRIPLAFLFLRGTPIPRGHALAGTVRAGGDRRGRRRRAGRLPAAPRSEEARYPRVGDGPGAGADRSDRAYRHPELTVAGSTCGHPRALIPTLERTPRCSSPRPRPDLPRPRRDHARSSGRARGDASRTSSSTTATPRASTR